MKTIYTLILLLAIAIPSSKAANYTISSNTTWSAAIGGSCWTCTITLAAGATLTIDASVTCGTCTISGGSIAVNNSFTCQSCSLSSESITMTNQTFTLQSATTTFTNVLFNASGTGGLNATGPMTLLNSTFNFSGSTYISNNGGQLSMTNSSVNLAGAASLTATAGPVNLASNSNIRVGDGTASSTSFLNINGPTLNIQDAGSSITIANKNNYYFNWSAYNSVSNSKTYTTTNNNLNCGGSGQNACSAPFVYGPASLSASGLIGSVVLAALLGDFNCSLLHNDAVLLRWSLSTQDGLGHFAIQRSRDARTWETIGTLLPAQLNGAYQFTDNNTPAGITYYRVQLVNTSGNELNSKIASVNAVPAEVVTIFPNPVTSAAFSLKFAAATDAVIHVFSIEGRLLYMTSLSGQEQYHIALPAAAAAAGLLVVQVITKEKTTSFSLVNKG
jgi:hypothetical protein